MKLNYRQLRAQSEGRLSESFGPLFQNLDSLEVQCRLPLAPLLLIDELEILDAVPMQMKPCSAIARFRLRHSLWYLQEELAPLGILSEASAQAILVLLSYMGIDSNNPEGKKFRLLDADIKFTGPSPQCGDLVESRVNFERIFQEGGMKLVYFSWECRVRGKAVLSCQSKAGFFSDTELDAAKGVFWNPALLKAAPLSEGEKIIPAKAALSQLDPLQLQRLSEGRHYEVCTEAVPPRNTPDSLRILGKEMLYLDRVSKIEPQGGPWAQGFIEAESTVTPELWFFASHFKNDPCMPGHLMMDACIQLYKIFFLQMGGYSGDGSEYFSPTPDSSFKFHCRGQVTPRSKKLLYQLFVEKIHLGQTPSLSGHVLVFCDGLKLFHLENFKLSVLRSSFEGREGHLAELSEVRARNA